MGVSPATGPTPNRGFEAAVQQRLGSVLNTLADLLKMAGPSSEIGQAINKMITAGAKHVPPGAVNPMGEKNMAEQTMMRATQNQNSLQQMAQARGGGQPSGQGGAATMPQPQGMAA